MYVKEASKHKIEQGDIYEDFVYVKWAEEIDDEIAIEQIKIPFLVVLTQICDLESDFRDRNKSKDVKRDKYIHSILVCPAYESESLRKGEHLKEHGIISESYSTVPWNIIKRNNNARYHYLEKDTDFNLPSLVVDFKHYYTVPSDIFYNCFTKHYATSLKPFYREDLSQRFASFLARIGLPNVGAAE